MAESFKFKWMSKSKHVNYIKKEELAMKLLWQFKVIDLIKIIIIYKGL